MLFSRVFQNDLFFFSELKNEKILKQAKFASYITYEAITGRREQKPTKNKVSAYKTIDFVFSPKNKTAIHFNMVYKFLASFLQDSS